MPDTLAGATHCAGTNEPQKSTRIKGRCFKSTPTRTVSSLYIHVAENTTGHNEEPRTLLWGNQQSPSLITRFLTGMQISCSNETLATPPENRVQFPAHMGQLTTACDSSSGRCKPSSGLCRILYARDKHKHRIHTYK